MPLHNLFSHPLYYKDLNLDMEFKSKTLGWLLEMFVIDNNTDQFLQSPGNLNENLIFKKLIEIVEQESEFFWSKIGYKKTPMKVTQCWANFMSGNGYIDDHYHSNSLISGVYFLDIDEKNSGKTVFSDPLHKMISVPVEKVTEYTMSVFEVEPIAGRLILFPSYLTHRSLPNLEKSKRITISFNILPIELGTKKELNYARLA